MIFGILKKLNGFILEGISLKEAICSLQSDFGEDNFSRFMVARWYKRFQDGDTSCQDKKGPGFKRTEDEQFKGVIALTRSRSEVCNGLQPLSLSRLS